MEKILSMKQMFAGQDSLTESLGVLNWAGWKNYRDGKEKMMKKYNEEWQEVREKVRRR